MADIQKEHKIHDLDREEQFIGELEKRHAKVFQGVNGTAIDFREVDVFGELVEALSYLEKAGVTNVVSLILGSKVRDSELRYLRGLAHLKHLDLSRTEVTPQGRRSIAESLPSLELLVYEGDFDEFTTESTQSKPSLLLRPAAKGERLAICLDDVFRLGSDERCRFLAGRIDVSPVRVKDRPCEVAVEFACMVQDLRIFRHGLQQAADVCDDVREADRIAGRRPTRIYLLGCDRSSWKMLQDDDKLTMVTQRGKRILSPQQFAFQL